MTEFGLVFIIDWRAVVCFLEQWSKINTLGALLRNSQPGPSAGYVNFLTILSHKSALKYKFTKSFFEKFQWSGQTHHTTIGAYYLAWLPPSFEKKHMILPSGSEKYAPPTILCTLMPIHSCQNIINFLKSIIKHNTNPKKYLTVGSLDGYFFNPPHDYQQGKISSDPD